MMILPQLPLYAIAIICGLLSFFVTRLTMPRIIRKLEAADIVGKDIHKSWKPIVAEMGGFGILFGFIIGMFSGIYMHDILTFPLCVVLIVILLVGIIGIVDDLLAEGVCFFEAVEYFEVHEPVFLAHSMADVVAQRANRVTLKERTLPTR